MQHSLQRLWRARPNVYPCIPTNTRSLSLPTILRPTFWSTMLPKPLRTPPSSTPTSVSSTPRTPNPATPFIVLSILIGSQAIQTIWLKQERARRARRAEAQMGVLRGVIERVQEGGDVDVEGILGVGVREEEARWWEVIQEVRDEEALFQSGKVRRAKRKEGEEREAREKEQGGEEEAEKDKEDMGDEEVKVKVESIGNVKFY